MIFLMNDSSGYICTILSQTVFESQPFYLVSRCPLLIVVVSQPVHLVSLCPLLSLSTFMSQLVCHVSLYPFLKFLKELNILVTFYSALLYFLNSSLSELLK